jgi:hypothetical protein
MQLPIMSGVFTDSAPDIRTSYPLNMVPVANQSGISEGYLRPADGMVAVGTGPGTCRGGIFWNGFLYRVMGSKLVRITSDGAVTTVGDVGSGGRVTMTYGPTYLAIASGDNLFLTTGGSVQQVTDPDLGKVLSVVWVDGYFLTTDGANLVVTELGDPFSVDPLKYGSSEVDPDPILSVLKVRKEVFAVNRHTIEVFTNIGGTGFPFQRIDGAQIPKGAVGTHASAVYLEAIAFVGGALNDPPAVWLGINGSAQKLSTREIDKTLQGYTDAQLAACVVEVRQDEGHSFLDIHLPDVTLTYDQAVSEVLGVPVWFRQSSGPLGWRVCAPVWAYNNWQVADTQSASFGYLTSETSYHWGQSVDWEFGTVILYNAGAGAIVHQLELVTLTGRVAIDADPKVWTQYSLDGLEWSQRRYISAGRIGDRRKRLVWFQQGQMRNWRVQRFGGKSDAHLAFARLEAAVEPLAV